MMVVGLIAIASLASWRRFGAQVEAKAEAQARCIDALDCGGGAPESGAEPRALLGAAAVGTQRSALATEGDDPNVPYDDADEVAYKHFDGELWVKSDQDPTAVHWTDVDQGDLSDCYLASSLGALAARNPGFIRDAIRDNGDGTYTVTFYEEGWWWWEGTEKVEITVNADFPMQGDAPVYMQPGDGNEEMWPMIIEKAYAEWRGGYDQIEESNSPDMLTALTGQESTYGDDFAAIYDAWERGDVVTLGTYDKGDAEGPLYDDHMLNTNHDYFVTDVDRQSGTITLQNPFGYGEKPPLVLTLDQVEQHFEQIATNPGGR
jgi:hypothetical protein